MWQVVCGTTGMTFQTYQGATERLSTRAGTQHDGQRGQRDRNALDLHEEWPAMNNNRKRGPVSPEPGTRWPGVHLMHLKQLHLRALSEKAGLKTITGRLRAHVGSVQPVSRAGKFRAVRARDFCNHGRETQTKISLSWIALHKNAGPWFSSPCVAAHHLNRLFQRVPTTYAASSTSIGEDDSCG